MSDNALDVAIAQLVQGTPQASLVRGLRGQHGKVLQPTKRQAVGKFAVGLVDVPTQVVNG
jgi:hypothetical protein